MSVGESFKRFIDVLAIIDAHNPFLEDFHRVLGGSAHFLVGVAFLNDCGLVRGQACFVSQIVQGNDGALERDFAQVLCADLIECFIRVCDRILHRRVHRFGRLFPIGNRQDGVCFCRGRRESVDRFQLSSAQIVKQR